MLAAMLADLYIIYICMYIYIYIYIYIPPWQTVHNVPKCMSCHKAIVVITGRVHCFFDCIYILHPSHLCEIWATLNRKLSYEMTDPKGLIYIKTNAFLYLVECNVVPINVFTLELCLNIVIRNGRTSFCFLWLWSQNYFWDWTKRVNPMKCNVNGLTFLSLIG